MIRLLQRSAGGRSQYARAPSPLLAYLSPWLTIAAGSIIPQWLTIATAPLLPPFGLLLLLGWRQLRPGLLPPWAGLPLGLVDDSVSGHPLGTAVALWSVAMLALDAIEMRFPWRNFPVDWGVAAVMVAVYVAVTGAIDQAAGGPPWLGLIVPQVALAVLVYPVVGRLVARVDRLRLRRYRVYG